LKQGISSVVLTISQQQPIHWLNTLFKQIAIHCTLLLLVTACASDPPLLPEFERAKTPAYDRQAAYNKPYKVRGKTYYPLLKPEGYREQGVASWYGAESGNRTAMGTRFNPQNLTAAHKTLPLPCKVKVTNLRNGRTVTVTVNDRGPFHGNRLIDLSHAAAKQLGVKGLSQVEVEYLNDSEEGS
jgi:rare lipoprotein A